MPFVEHFCHIPPILGRKRLKYCTFFITLHALWAVFIPNLGTVKLPFEFISPVSEQREPYSERVVPFL